LEYDPEFASTASFDTDSAREPRDGMPVSILVGLGPYASVILSQDE
jgi:hypothetical protein